MNIRLLYYLLKNDLLHFSRMRIYGRRSPTVYHCFLLSIFLILISIIIYIDNVYEKYIDYTKFIQTFPFSSVPFWKDTRLPSQEILQPIITINEVNLSNATIVIAACCRNVRKYLKGFQRNIYLITSLFGDYRIYLEESDSDDETFNYLNEWKLNDSQHIRIHSRGNQRYIMQSRTARLSLCRNTLLQLARDEIPTFDYYFPIDVDVGSSPSFEIKDFLTNFIYPSTSWIAMTATQRSEYYDIWALRVDPILSFDCWEVVDRLTSGLIRRDFLSDHIVTIHQEPIPRNVSLIEVQSAFGGAAIYNGEYLNKNCFYNGTILGGYWSFVEQCEHVPFHYCLQQYASQQKIYINPQFQIC